MKHLAVTLTVLLATVTSAAAQSRRIASPQGRSATEVGGSHHEQAGYVDGRWIEILYGRPILRGRSPFGPPDFFRLLNDGAPVWRAGANVSTRLRTDRPLRFGETIVQPGEYTVFIDLDFDGWTFIVTTWPAQTTYDQHDRTALFGAFHYHPGKDVVREAMTLETLEHSFDQLSWQFLDMHEEGGKLALLWDDRMAWVAFGFGEP